MTLSLANETNALVTGLTLCGVILYVGFVIALIIIGKKGRKG